MSVRVWRRDDGPQVVPQVVEDHLDPLGWLLATPAHGLYRYGLCPACLSDDHCDAD